MLSKYVKTLSVCACVLLLAGCSEYAKMLRSEDDMARLEYAKKLFEQEEYIKTTKVLEPIYQKFKNTKDGESADWMMAYSWYMSGSYELSTYLMGNFASTYPMNKNAQQAAFLSAESSYKLSPDSYLDPEYTIKGITALQRFIDRYPSAPQIARADSMIRELSAKQDKKAFDIAYNYYRMEDYDAAVKAFSNVLEDTPATTYREKIMYYRFRAATIYAGNSIPDKQQDRVTDALTYGRLFLKQFPESSYAPEVEKLVKAMEERSTALNSVIRNLDKKGLGSMKAKKLNKQIDREMKSTKKQENNKE